MTRAQLSARDRIDSATELENGHKNKVFKPGGWSVSFCVFCLFFLIGVRPLFFPFAFFGKKFSCEKNIFVKKKEKKKQKEQSSKRTY